MIARSSHPGGGTLAATFCDAPKRLGRLQRVTHDSILEASCEGLTGHEVSLVTGFDRHSVQPRISELRRKGLVIASGKRRRNPSGKTAIVWIASGYADGVLRSPDSN